MIKAMEILGVKTVTEIGAEFDRPGRRRFPNPANDRAQAVGALPGDFRAALQFLDAHAGRLKHDVLTVVQLPIFGQNSALGEQPLIKAGIGKWGNDGGAWENNAR